jgi:hypothetical protein
MDKMKHFSIKREDTMKSRIMWIITIGLTATLGYAQQVQVGTNLVADPQILAKRIELMQSETVVQLREAAVYKRREYQMAVQNDPRIKAYTEQISLVIDELRQAKEERRLAVQKLADSPEQKNAVVAAEQQLENLTRSSASAKDIAQAREALHQAQKPYRGIVTNSPVTQKADSDINRLRADLKKLMQERREIVEANRKAATNQLAEVQAAEQAYRDAVYENPEYKSLLNQSETASLPAAE